MLEHENSSTSDLGNRSKSIKFPDQIADPAPASSPLDSTMNFREQIEQLLWDYAEPYTPPGSDPKAVIHQWIHALNSGSGLFAEAQGANKSKVIAGLKSAGFLTATENLKKPIREAFLLKKSAQKGIKFIDLFAGIGGMRLGFEDIGGTCVFSSEYDKSAQSTYLTNHGEYPFGDITGIDEKDIPDHDVLLAGFPCQPFSHAGVSARNAIGKSHGFECDTQGTLFFHIMRIVEAKRPKVLFLENVRNIENHDSGKTFKVIRQSVEDAGYDFRHQLIDSSSLVPQRRKRCYMVCFAKDLDIDFEYPEFSGDPLPLRSILEDDIDDSYTISDRLWTGHINRTSRNLKRGTGFTAHLANLDKPSNTIVARYGKDGKECLIPQENKNPRLLTPRECARLQGFPETFKIPAARTPAYKQFGNSVSVPVIARLAHQVKEYLI